MLEELARYLIENPDAGIIAYLLFFIVAAAIALHKEWVVLGPYHAHMVTDYDAQTATLNDVQAALTDQRVLNERATVTIEFMKADADRLKLELAELKAQRPRKA